ncbi:hypothetical protein FJQ54_16785 [Sandaracinobacter neustonicus]|uniref:Uncharacterized protein n=1 Tax=Sandaracinobacter neustonicus TaxID=1715348 RepID=A0A501XDT9_9SPHN|nr:hypothetical protein [Sandaracinobacter neustonicus]TPE58702.1 hypothetical protein FJQ54_16785 [Sandaracinobacter neustonicus]
MPDQADSAPRDTGPQGGTAFNILAGAALGGLVGLLVGLSASPIAASAAAAVLALLVTFFGFGGSIGALRANVSGARMVGFGLAMTAALLAGIAVRAHGSLGPDFQQRVARFEAGGLSPDKAQDLAIYEQLGLRTGFLADVEAPTAVPATSPFAFNFNQDSADANCGLLNARYIPDPNERLEAMAQSAEPWASIGRAGKAKPAAERAAFAEAAYQRRCGPAAAR